MRNFGVLALLFMFSSFIHAAPQGVYGSDDRMEASNYPNSVIRNYARSVAAMIHPASISLEWPDVVMFIASSLGSKENLCNDERFTDQPSLSYCSGFLVKDDLLLTAGHCVENRKDCSEFIWVFDYTVEHSNSTAFYAKRENIYRCKKLIARRDSFLTGRDFALIRLDRKVKNRSPLPYRSVGKIKRSEEIAIIGHPSGLPMKIAGNAKVRFNWHPNFFKTNLDAFAGNSGSPVVNEKTGLVEGILSKGGTDYVFNQSRGCMEVKKKADNKGFGEQVARIKFLKKLFYFDYL